ncbi:hypothetical protein SL040_004619 [Aeromonas salmonicida]|nr:hypothetical protein [Aeromonas salmonicida]
MNITITLFMIMFSSIVFASNSVFTISFKDQSEYVKSLQAMRESLGREMDNVTVEGANSRVYQLNPTSSNEGLIIQFNNLLHDSSDELSPVRFVLSPTDLYLTGFIYNNVYYHYTDQSTITVSPIHASRSQSINLSSRYLSMERAAQVDRLGLEISRENLISDMFALTNIESSRNTANLAVALMRYATVISEATRFRQIQRNIRVIFGSNSRTYNISESDYNLTLRWDRLSNLFLNTQPNQENNIDAGNVRLTGNNSILSALGLLLYCTSSPSPRSFAQNNTTGTCASGRGNLREFDLIKIKYNNANQCIYNSNYNASLKQCASDEERAVFSSRGQIQISNTTAPYLPYCLTVPESFFNNPKKWDYLTVEYCDETNKRQLFDENFLSSEVNLTLNNNVNTTISYYKDYLIISDLSSKGTDLNLFISQPQESDNIVPKQIVSLDFNYNFNGHKWYPSYYSEGNVVPSTTKNKTFYNIETKKLITEDGKCFASSVDFCHECQKNLLLSEKYCSIDNDSTKWNILIKDGNKKEISLVSKNNNQYLFATQGDLRGIPFESKFNSMAEPWRLNTDAVHYKFGINNFEELRKLLSL